MDKRFAHGNLVPLPLYVDVVWASQRPQGIAARRFVELLDARRT